MKKNRLSFLIAEVLLAAIAGVFIHKIFAEDTPDKKVAVILQESGSSKWDTVINGMKQSAKNNGLHLIICNTDDIENAKEESELIADQLANDVDGFVICPAPGADTEDEINRVCGDKTYVFIGEDVYSTDMDAQRTEGSSDRIVVGPDNYNIGVMLAQQIAADDKDGLKGKRIGIITGRDKTESADSRLAGLMDTFDTYECEVSWVYYYSPLHYTCKVVDARPEVDYLVIADTSALEEVAANAENGLYKGARIYGVGSSIRAISLVDSGNVTGLVIPDGYKTGYDSINEIGKKLSNPLYSMESVKEDIMAIHREDIFTDEVERFMYSYE